MKKSVVIWIKMPHFQMLPQKEVDLLSVVAILQHFSKGEVLAQQGQTSIDHIHIVKNGKISIYDEKSSKCRFGGFIKKGEVFGGISLLMNAGISLRTVLVDEDTDVYLIIKVRLNATMSIMAIYWQKGVYIVASPCFSMMDFRYVR